MSFRREAARALETGRWDGLVSRALATAWGPIAARGLVRPAVVTPGIALVCVGGATLGGSGKTRVAIACARELAAVGARVALVGHAYRAAPDAARIVSVDDALEDVGDEALVCARALAGSGVAVVIGPTRQSAIDHAARLSPDVLVLDGPLRIRGRTHGILSLLAVDANRPWGSGRLPPSGDLRAAREVLLSHADYVVPVDAMPARVRWPNGTTAPLASLRSMSGLALFTAIARPDRLVRALAAAGVRPREIVSAADHGPVLRGETQSRLRIRRRRVRQPEGAEELRIRRRRVRQPEGAEELGVDVEAWVATEKCALHLPSVSLDAPLAVLEADLALPPHILKALAGLSSRGRPLAEAVTTPPVVQRLHGVP